MRQFSNGEGAPDSLPPEAPTFSWPKFGPWLLGLLILSGVIVAAPSGKTFRFCWLFPASSSLRWSLRSV